MSSPRPWATAPPSPSPGLHPSPSSPQGPGQRACSQPGWGAHCVPAPLCSSLAPHPPIWASSHGARSLILRGTCSEQGHWNLSPGEMVWGDSRILGLTKGQQTHGVQLCCVLAAGYGPRTLLCAEARQDTCSRLGSRECAVQPGLAADVRVARLQTRFLLLPAPWHTRRCRQRTRCSRCLGARLQLPRTTVTSLYKLSPNEGVSLSGQREVGSDPRVNWRTDGPWVLTELAP